MPKELKFLVFITILQTEIHVESGQSFKRRPSFDSYDTTSFVLSKVDSLTHCAGLCILKTICSSFYYNYEEQSCKLNSEIFWKTGTHGVVPWKYYEKNSENIAVSKNAFQISTHDNLMTHDASQAIDGTLVDQTYGLRCSTTSYEVSPWLIVDMEENYTVDFIVIFNRRDEKGDRLHNVDVKLGSSNTDFPEICGSYSGPAKNGQVVYIVCHTGSYGQFVRIQIVGTDGIADNVLTLCELEINIK